MATLHESLRRSDDEGGRKACRPFGWGRKSHVCVVVGAQRVIQHAPRSDA